MALINCPECSKEISSKAISCPNCGLPINLSSQSNEIRANNLMQFPELPSNLDIGKQIVNWAGNAAFDGEYFQNENVVTSIPSGKVSVNLHTHGIQVIKGFTFYPIHNSQIISIKQTSKEELAKIDKSVIGRAVVGGLILGPLGAIVGSISGIGSKEKIKNQHYLVINYWELESKKPQTLLIRGEEFLINAFIKRHNEEEEINITQHREPEKQSNTLGVIVLILIAAFIIFILLNIFN